MHDLQNTLRAQIAAQLAAAPDSAAKTEMLDELTGNLYPCCQERLADGATEEEALQDAMAQLGDVDELLAWLRESERTPALPAVAETAASEKDAPIHSVVVELQNSDVVLGCQTVAEPVVEYESCPVIMEERDGVLYVKEQQTASRNFLARRLFMESGEVHITLPSGASWRHIALRTQCGEIQVNGELHAEHMILESGQGDILCRDVAGDVTVQTQNGDINILNHGQVLRSVQIKTPHGDISLQSNVQTLAIETVNGDVEVHAQGQPVQSAHIRTVNGDVALYADTTDAAVHTTNGDIELQGRLGSVQLQTTSGDVTLQGAVQVLRAHTVNGDVELHADQAPESVTIDSLSGDIELDVPPQPAFKARLHTQSGEVSLHGANINFE